MRKNLSVHLNIYIILNKQENCRLRAFNKKQKFYRLKRYKNQELLVRSRNVECYNYNFIFKIGEMTKLSITKFDIGGD